MPTNISLFQERAAEIRAAAEANAIVRILNDAAMEPSTKRFTRNRATRQERWLQLAQMAERQAQGLSSLQAAPRKATKPKAKPAVVPSAPAEPSATPTVVAS